MSVYIGDKTVGNRPEVKICFIDPFYDVSKRSEASGTSHYLFRSLQKHWGKVDPVGPLNIAVPIFARLYGKIGRTLTWKRYLIRWDLQYCKNMAAEIDKLNLDKSHDVIFTTYPQALPYIRSNLPVVLWSDCTFISAFNVGYPGVVSACDASFKRAIYLERRALEKAKLIVYSNWWAARSAVHDYGINEEKIAVIPLGANLDFDPGRNSSELRLTSRSILRLLFIGLDWKRKGGDIALNTLSELTKLGINTHLTIVGPAPLDLCIDEKKIGIIAKINKDREDEMKVLGDLYRNSHFLILPTRAECCAVVYNEACAYGLPIITTDVGGVGTAVKDRVNGRLLTLQAEGVDFAKTITEIWQSPEEYGRLSLGARMLYEKELNYDACGTGIRKAWERVMKGEPVMASPEQALLKKR